MTSHRELASRAIDGMLAASTPEDLAEWAQAFKNWCVSEEMSAELAGDDDDGKAAGLAERAKRAAEIAMQMAEGSNDPKDGKRCSSAFRACIEGLAALQKRNTVDAEAVLEAFQRGRPPVQSENNESRRSHEEEDQAAPDLVDPGAEEGRRG